MKAIEASHIDQANRLLEAGRIGDALAELDLAVAADASAVDPLLLRAATLQATGNNPGALVDWQRIIALQPTNYDANFNAGRIHIDREDFAAARDCLERALNARPDSAAALDRYGFALHKLGRSDEALTAFARATEVDPDFVDALRHHADLLNLLRGPTASAAMFERALEAYDRTLARLPTDKDMHNNRGTVLQAMGRFADALASYDRAIELKPDFADALNNRGTLLEVFDRMEEAEASIRAALRADPQRISAHWNLALCLLRRGQFEEGWKEYEWRWKKPEFRKYDFGFKQPRWDGTQGLEGKVLLLTAEQGLGDTLQLVRYIPHLRARGARIVLLVPGALVQLLGHSFSGIQVVNSIKHLPPFDLHCPLLSLPWALRTTLETLPGAVPYLFPPLDRLVMWEPPARPAGKPRIGVVWAGNPSHANDFQRSIPLSQMLPLMLSPGIECLVLQKEISANDRELLQPHAQLVVASQRLNDFADTAAAISQLDLVIAVDTSVAHLAGAMGKPVWILLPPTADWRWLAGSNTSPWYPTARLFRRLPGTEWDTVFAQVMEELSRFAPDRSTPATAGGPSGIFDALNAAAALHNAGRLDDAIAIYEGVLSLDPGSFDANHLLGMARRRQRRYDEAETALRRALERRPDNVPALTNLMRVQMAAGKHAQAMEVHDKLTGLTPENPEVWSERGVSLLTLGRHDEALASLDRTLRLAPDHIHALNNRAVVLLHLRRHAEALASLDHLLASHPDFVDAIGNRGLALLGLGRTSEAIANYERGLGIRPESTTLLCNLGISLMAEARYVEAIVRLRQAIAIDPEHVDANWNLSLALLASGQFLEGWRQYEWRWRRVEMAPHHRKYPIAEWTGSEDLGGRCIFVHFEQGFGDTLQFMRYLPMLEARGARILFGIPEPLRALVKASFPKVEVFSGNETLPPFDFHIPLLSLPRAFGTEIDSIPAGHPPYLRVPEDRLGPWRRRLPKGRPVRVGLVWSGNPAHKYDNYRSLGAAELEPLFDLPGFRFHSLQKDINADDAAALARFDKLDPLGQDFTDFADTAAAITRLDLVISVDTSVAHLAGALGKPVWIILPSAADWRWLTIREDSPWYPTARLFRQRQGQPRAESVSRLRLALREFRKALKR